MTRSWDRPTSPRLAERSRTDTMSLKIAARGTTVAAATVVAIAGSVGVGYAYWTSTGTGTGTASAGSAKTLTVSTGTVSGLYPTGPATAGKVSVTNTNDFAVVISAGSFGTTSVNGNPGPCTASSVVFRVGVLPTTTVAKGASVDVPFTAQMSNEAENGCQSPASFSATLTVTAQSAVTG